MGAQSGPVDSVGAARRIADLGDRVVEASVQLNYTTVLNIVFLALAAALIYPFRAHRGTADGAGDEQADGGLAAKVSFGRRASLCDDAL